MRRRKRSIFPWLIAAVLVLLLVLAQRHGPGSDRAFTFEGAHSARVERVVDGDTVRLVGLGSVRLIGIDTPEVYGHVDCFGPEASAFAKSLMRRGADVRYRVGTEARDRYGRLLAYIWLPDGRLVNGLLAERGYARQLTIRPNNQLAPAFSREVSQARKANRGLWSACG